MLFAGSAFSKVNGNLLLVFNYCLKTIQVSGNYRGSTVKLNGVYQSHGQKAGRVKFRNDNHSVITPKQLRLLSILFAGKTLKNLVQHRFGDLPVWAIERIDRADVDTLERWSYRVLDARALDDGASAFHRQQ